MKRFNYYLITCCVAASLALACGTQKNIVDNGNQIANTSAFSPEKYLKQINDNTCKSKWLTAKIKCTIAMDDQDISTKGELRMKQDEVIQIILNDPLAGIVELGRLEFATDHLKMLDRYNKKYIDLPYSEVDFLKKTDINFNSLQNLFWNKLFVPGKNTVSTEDFKFTDEKGGEPSYDSNVALQFVDDVLSYTFVTEPASTSLIKTLITGTKDPESQCEFSYSNFQNFQGKPFPHSMRMSFIMGKQNASIQFTMNSVKNKSGWETNTKIPTKYSQIDPEKLFKSLIGK